MSAIRHNLSAASQRYKSRAGLHAALTTATTPRSLLNLITRPFILLKNATFCFGDVLTFSSKAVFRSLPRTLLTKNFCYADFSETFSTPSATQQNSAISHT